MAYRVPWMAVRQKARVCAAILLVVSPSVWAALPQNELSEDERLGWAEWREQRLYPRLAAEFLGDSTQARGARALAQANILYFTGHYDSALVLFRSNVDSVPAVKGRVLVRMAHCLAQTGKHKEARALLLSWDSLRANAGWWEAADRVLMDMILTDLHLRNSDKLDSIERRLKLSPQPVYAAWLRLQQGRIAEKLGRKVTARTAWLAALRQGGEAGDSAYTHLKQLAPVSVWSGISTPDLLTLAGAWCRRYEYGTCLAAVDTVLSRKSLAVADRRLALDRRATALYGIGRYREAARLWMWMLDSVEARPEWLRNAGKSLRKAGLRDSADRLDTLLLTKFPFGAESAQDLWVTAFEAEQEGLWDSALVTYAKLQDSRFGKEPRRSWSAFRSGLVWYKRGQLDSAARVFRSAADSFPDQAMTRGAALLFLGDVALQQKHDSLARSVWLAAVQDFPLGYYAHRARARLAESGLMEKGSVPTPTAKNLDRQGIITWLRKAQGVGPLVDSSLSRQRLRQVGALLFSGFQEEAMAVYDDARKNEGGRLEFLWLYGDLFYRAGDYQKSYALARQFLDRMDRRTMIDAPLAVLRWVYPLPFYREVIARTPEGLDPLFVMAVMRQESAFDAGVVSWAGAYGLLQLMPATANRMAIAQGVGPVEREWLGNPLLNIRLGVAYLDTLQQEYLDPTWVLANYNAGPGPAKRWKKQAADEQMSYDMAVEEISYWETRDYVKRVLGNWWNYQIAWMRP